MEYLITDIRTLKTTWIAAESPRIALIIHENAWRALPLPADSTAKDYGQGSVIDMAMGESAIRGLREHVTR